MRKQELCTNCGIRKGKHNWGDSFALTHGFTTLRCDVCVYEAQLKHALQRARFIPSLIWKLALARLFEK